MGESLSVAVQSLSQVCSVRPHGLPRARPPCPSLSAEASLLGPHPRYLPMEAHCGLNASEFLVDPANPHLPSGPLLLSPAQGSLRCARGLPSPHSSPEPVPQRACSECRLGCNRCPPWEKNEAGPTGGVRGPTSSRGAPLMLLSPGDLLFQY